MDAERELTAVILPPAAQSLTRISHGEIRKIVITPVLLRCGIGSGSVTYGTVCFLAAHSPRLVL